MTYRILPFRRSFRFASLALAAGLMLSTSVAAQNAPSVEDLRALRFYIEQNEEAATQAEIRRLKTQFPGWTPPSDLSALLKTEPTTEIANIYARLARGDVDGAERILAETTEAYPDWTVPADLREQMKVTGGQVAFDRAVSSRDATEAVRVASQTPNLLRCDRINNTWALAELQASKSNSSGAYAAYRQIVNTCTKVPDIISTIEKADAVTNVAQLNSLVETAKSRFLTQASTFDSLEKRLLRGRGVEVDDSESTTASAQPAPKSTRPSPAPARKTTTSQPARTARAPAAVAPARSMVSTTARTVKPSVANPIKLPTRGDGRLNATRAAASAGNNRACLANSANPRSIDIAYERAWCAYNLERPLEAMAYFDAASRSGLSGEAKRDARFGLALSYLKFNMTEDAARLAAATNYSAEQRREIESIILDQRGVAAFQLKEYQKAINYFDALEEIDNGLARDLALLRGYAYLNLKDYAAARVQIESLHEALATPETRKAMKILYASGR